MLDKHVQKLAQPTLTVIAARLKSLGITANQITLAGFAFGIFASFLIAVGLYREGLAFIVLNRLADGLDGARARLDDALSDRGGFLDILCDFIFYASVPLAFAFADVERNALVSAIVLFSFIGTGSSFLAYANFTKSGSRAGGNEDSKNSGKKGDASAMTKLAASLSKDSRVALLRKALHYIGGITESSETTIFFFLICLIPQGFPVFGIVFALLCFITTATRAYSGWRDFS